MKSWPPKDPDEVLDYGFDWRPRKIDDDPIIDSGAALLEGTVTIDHHAVGAVEGVPSGFGTVTWLSGGAEGETCLIRLWAITGSGRHLDQSMRIKIKTR